MAKYHITLACAFGASTSVLVKNMETIAAEKNVDAQIVAIPTTQAISTCDQTDIIMLGPQVRYELPRFEKQATGTKTKVIAIPAQYYGDADGKSTLALALKTILGK